MRALPTAPAGRVANASGTHHRWAVEVLNSLGEPPAPARSCWPRHA